MSIYKLKPAIKDYLWGGTKLKEWGKGDESNSIISETWELSFHDDGLTLVDGLDKPLKEVVTKEEIGTKASKFSFFPVLIKFINSAQNLSVQVHPSDKYALKNENSFGKTEMWYILEAEKDAGIYVGFKGEETKESVRAAIENNTIMDKLNFFKVKPGDSFFIPSGTVHAIGKGITLIEIQQNSNLTYRLYDYNRKGIDGKTRPLHIDKALEVLDFKPYKNKRFSKPQIGKCKYFSVYRFNDLCKYIKSNKQSFIAVSFIKGTGTIGGIEFKKGDSFFISASSDAYVESDNCEYILTLVE